MATQRPTPQLQPISPPPPDAAVRARALDITQSFLVRAPAGSGKTELLVQRMVKLLAAVKEPESVVAVTFTRKAAGEMRARVLGVLAQTGSPLAATPNRLRITTLDALALALASRLPWLTRLGPAPQPTEDAQDLYLAAAHATLAAIESNDDPQAAAARDLLLRFDNNAARCEELLAGLLKVRDQWVPQLATLGSRATMEANFRSLLESELRSCHALITAETPASNLPPPTLEALPEWQSFAESILTKAGTLRKHNPALPLGEAACRALHQLRQLPSHPLDGDALDRLLPVLQLLAPAEQHLQRIFRERGQCDFTAVTLAARAALQQEGVPTALAYVLDARLQHLLVDEFQDTSTAQFDLLRALTADWRQPGDRRTLFLVGDPMQSIYGFRAARVDLFLQNPLHLTELQLTANFRSLAPLVAWCNAAFAPVFGKQEDALTGRVRFSEAHAVHESFAPAVELHAVAGRTTEAECVAQIAAREIASGIQTIAILVHARSHLKAILPALRAQPFIGRKLSPLSSSPVATDLLAVAQAILNPADRVAWLALLRAPWCGLTLADLHALAEGDASRDTVVAELWALRRDRITPDGRIRAQRVMDILAAAGAKRARQPLRDLVAWCWRQLGGPLCLPKGANPADAAAVLDHLQVAEARPGGLDPAALDLDLARLFTPTDPEIKPGLQIMTIHEAKGLAFDVVILPGLGRTPPPEDPKLLHWLDWPDGGGSGRRPWVLAARAERGAEPAGFQYLGRLLRARARQEDLRQLYVAATRAKLRMHLVTELKLTKDGEPYANTPLHWLWPAHGDAFRSVPLASASAPAAGPAVLRPLYRVDDAAWSPPAPSPLRWHGLASSPPPSEAQPTLHAADAFARRLGVALHALLRELAGAVPLAWSPERLDFLLRQAGFSAADLSEARRRASAALDRTLADERGRWLLAPHEDAHTEWALTDCTSGPFRSSRLDLSFVENSIRWIVDYKFSAHEGAGLDAFLDAQVERYRPQLDAYAAIIAPLSPHPIRCALYFPLLAGWREWTPK